MIIDGTEISDNHPPYVIAEIGAGHCGSLDMALDLIRDARRAGAHAIKLQTYTADSMTLPMTGPLFEVQGEWKGWNLYKLYDEAQTPRHWHPIIFKEAKRIGLTAFSTPFSPDDVAFLETLDCPAYKVASCEICHLELLEAIRETKKPVILSTGMADFYEVEKAMQALYGRDVAILHCVSGYPTPVQDTNMWRIDALQQIYPRHQIGFSDHTNGTEAVTIAVSRGATIIEKHIAEGGSFDSSFAASPLHFSQVVQAASQAWRAMKRRENPSCEKPTRLLRRSVFVARPIAAGQEIEREDLAVIRPSGGFDPLGLESLIGRRAAVDLEPGTPLLKESLL